MLIPQHYPLIQDLGFPEGERAARQRWVAEVRGNRVRSRRAALIAAIILPLSLGVFGILPWVFQRVFTADRLHQHLTSNMPHGNAHLGAEYYNIAAALVDGRGFSDPFVVESGPTAWMPPLLVWIQASLIWLFDGDRYWVMLSVVLIKTLLLCACGAVVVMHDWRKHDGWVGFGVFATFIVVGFTACFSFTHDGWLILAGITATVFGLAHLGHLLQIDQSRKNGSSEDRVALTFGKVAAWGILGGLIALSSPVAGFTWAVGTAVCLLPRAPVKLLLAALISMAVVTPWAIRNKVVLGKLVPVKSNVFFEFDQSMALDSDGLLDYQTMSRHPYHAGKKEHRKYIKMGEIAYLETKKERFLSQLESESHMFYGKVRNRLIGTTLWPAGFNEYRRPGPTLPFKWLLYPLPALVVLGLLVFGHPLSPLQRSAIVVYVAYLFPYVVCSYYPRYGFPLMVVKMLLCYWAISWVIIRVRRARRFA